MVSCKHCGAQNNLSGKFCAQCGWSLDPADAAAMQNDVAKDVAEGQRLFGENHLPESLALADSVLQRDPDNIAAYALRGDCLERLGDIEGALASYEHVVTLKPDSPLDRIRVAQLRRMAASQPMLIESKPDRRYSILAACAAFVLLVSSGSAVVLANHKDRPNTETVAASDETTSRPFLTPAPVPTQGARTNSTTPGEQPVDGNKDENPGKAGTDDSNPAQAHRPDMRASNRESGDRVPGTLPPIVSNANDNVPLTPPQIYISPDNEKTGETGTKDPDPQPVESDTKKPDTPTHPAVIDIKPSVGDPTAAVNKAKEDANEGNNLIRVARQYFLAGDYSKAAKAYEQAIRLGVSPASANHRLAQCYVNMNRRADALAAYKRALASYQNMVLAGVGDKRLIESYMDECRQAIKLLQ